MNIARTLKKTNRTLSKSLLLRFILFVLKIFDLVNEIKCYFSILMFERVPFSY